MHMSRRSEDELRYEMVVSRAGWINFLRPCNDEILVIQTAQCCRHAGACSVDPYQLGCPVCHQRQEEKKKVRGLSRVQGYELRRGKQG